MSSSNQKLEDGTDLKSRVASVVFAGRVLSLVVALSIKSPAVCSFVLHW